MKKRRVHKAVVMEMYAPGESYPWFEAMCLHSGQMGYARIKGSETDFEAIDRAVTKWIRSNGCDAEHVHA